MKALLVGDVHLNDRAPSMRTDTYTEDILDKLRFTVVTAKSILDLDAVIWSGDIFHTKQPHRTSHWLVQQVLNLGQEYPCPWLIVPGNHDMQHDRIDSLGSQPLGTLFQAGSAMPLIGSHPKNQYDRAAYRGCLAQSTRDMGTLVPNSRPVAQANG